ncbi:MAG: hypothetical protein JWR72_171 [Flavisolibacter sp.]|jgi:hypothetical protein|nr:hypothetical protein [Flavisolibacter sp.]
MIVQDAQFFCLIILEQLLRYMSRNYFCSFFMVFLFSTNSFAQKAGVYTDAGKNTCGSIYDRDSLG